MTFCRLCGERRKLIKAHIIPESLYGPLREDSKIPRIYSTAEDAFPKRAPVGIYDNEILCDACDNRIGDWDNYAQNFLLKPLESYGSPDELTKKESFVVWDIEYPIFKLFFVSLLWRADQSSHEFFRGIDLGRSWRGKAKEMLLAQEPGSPEDFGVTLVRYEHRLAARTIYNPEKVRSEALNFYRFSLGSYVAMIKVDSRPFDKDMEQFVLRPSEPLTIALFKYEDSQLFQNVLQHVREGLLAKKRRERRAQSPAPAADGWRRP